jgi:signal transduction histidine kinase
MQAIKEMCERFSSTTQLPIIFHEHGDIDGLEKNKQLMLFRITQELINNTIKHAQATQLMINIEATDKLIIIAEDDGVGFNIDDKQDLNRKGLGLFSIQNRSSLLGATLEFERERKKGTRVTLTLPLTHEQ